MFIVRNTQTLLASRTRGKVIGDFQLTASDRK